MATLTTEPRIERDTSDLPSGDVVRDGPNPGTSALVAYVKDLFLEARTKKRPLVQRWVKNYNVLHNRTWSAARAPYLPSPELPEMWPIVASMVGWETDQRAVPEVKPSAVPFGPNFQLFANLADDLQQTMQSTWTTNDMDTQIEQMLWDAKVYGTGFLKSIWDPTLFGGMGDAINVRVDPFTLYPDPNAKSTDDWEYVTEVYTITLSELDRRFPGAREKVGADLLVENLDTAPDRLSSPLPKRPLVNPGPISPATTPAWGMPTSTSRLSRMLDHRLITVFECWMREHVHTDVTTAEGEHDITVNKWRCVIVAGNTVLLDEPAFKLFAHGEHPYERHVSIETGEFWGQSLVELLTPAQISINRLLMAMEHNIALSGNPVMVDDARSGIGRAAITNRPGTRLTKNSSAEVKWLDPPQIHPQMSGELIQFYKGEMENISGLSAIVRGFAPTHRNSENVVSSVQESAFVRVRLSLRNLERTLRRIENKRAALIIDFYDAPRIVALVGGGGQQSALALKSFHWWTPSDKGRIPLRYQLVIEAGSSLPTSRQARLEMLLRFYALGIVDEEAVLEMSGLPNWQRIAARVREMKAAAGVLGQPPGARQRTRQ